MSASSSASGRAGRRLGDGAEMPAPLFQISPGGRGEGQGRGVRRRRGGVNGRLPGSGADHGREALVAPQAVQQAPPARRHKRGGILRRRGLGLGAVQDLGEPQPSQPLYQAHAGGVGPGLARLW